MPKMAKSAATMIALGANKIWMSQTSELGPIDPQVLKGNSRISAHNIITSYEELLKKAVATKGNLEPYLQQLGRHDASQIQNLKASQKLAEDIAITALKTGMMKGQSVAAIKKKIMPFTDPTITSSHGRRIGKDRVGQCAIAVENIPLDSELWQLLWELYVRTDWYVTYRMSKVVETRQHSFGARMVAKGEE